ncbi:hypothetical protein QFC22_005183 [Naganishia vaughanmartiniae]|uniref:Uncharacterized protein n=1 Tax=Naganishia vaughanmartiniae TaxID=1424756 RepID=A0ACC2WWA7_9TREE|nr:hypothetical protein QFC22_005183 [Naganishia vaughanmartiniae]
MGNDALKANPPNSDITINTKGSDWLWAVFAVMLLTDFLMMGWMFTLPKGRRTFHHMSIFILTTAAIAYFSMASNLGGTPVLVEFNGNEQGLTRAICWRFGGVFLQGCAALIYIWVILLGPALKSSAALGPDFRNAYLRSAAYLSFIWALYPIAWGLADGANVISPDAEMIFYGILDLLAKPVFTLWHVYQISRLDYTKMQLQSGKFSEGAAMIRENELHSVNNSALKNARADATATGRFSEATAREV